MSFDSKGLKMDQRGPKRAEHEPIKAENSNFRPKTPDFLWEKMYGLVLVLILVLIRKYLTASLILHTFVICTIYFSTKSCSVWQITTKRNNSEC